MSTKPRPKPAFKVWLETDEGYVFGPGVYGLLKKVKETGTLKEAATSLGMSYRFAWGLVKRAEKKIGHPLLEAHKGGRAGGGGAELTEVGSEFLEEFSKIEAIVSTISSTGGGTTLPEGISRVEGRVSAISVEGEKVALDLRLDRPSIIRLISSRTLVEDVSEGDPVTAELTTFVRSIKKSNR
jgi:molybdate transport repressor ModE-like protein